MKKRLGNLFKIIAFLLVLAISVLAVTTLVRRKDSNYKYADFFDQAKAGHIDVLFMGSSHVINAINPVTLYEDYGYTSYNMGGHGSVMQATYWELIEALQYCTPKVVVVDAYMLEKNYQYLDVMEENADKSERNTSVEQLHLNMDAWPLDRLKIAAINDLIQDQETRNEFLFDFIVYHSRWSELTSEDYKTVLGTETTNPLMGGEMRYQVELSPTSFPDPAEGEILSEHTVGQEYLMKIIDECQRDGIQVVVTYMPCCATTTDKIAANSAAEIAANYGVPYINMLNMGIIDYRSDLNDTGHLNATGAIKVTDYMGQWLTDNADLADHRGDVSYSDWADKVALFNDELKDMATSGDDLYTRLNQLSLNKVSYVIYFNQGSNALKDDDLMHLVENLAGTTAVRDASAAENAPYILIKDLSNGVYEAYGENGLDGVATGLGHVVYQPVEQNFRFLYPTEDESLNYLYDDDHLGYDIQLITYDSESGQIFSHDYFRSFGGTYRVD
ncbi:hypothetical protein [Butyrivibrio proteoclasticus]|uniref:hypothetical protein n=1 Tax=Butyrivibrio proteoclasticus TaxID=43305 RepID=UPI00047B98E7|nr:hypothetical protein [Butyrivibrio proteoclasticus]